MKIRYSDNAATTLSAPVEPGHTVIVVASASQFPILSSGDWMYVTVEEEVVRVTNTSGNVFTCEAFIQAHGTGASIENRITADVMDDAQDADIYDTASDRPGDGTMRHGEIFANSTDKQVGIGDATGNPVDLVSVRFHSSVAGYLIGDLVTYDSGIWKCLLSHTGAWNEANWEPVSGGGGGMAWEASVSGDVTAVASIGYLTYTNTAARNVNLPAGVVGESVGINDVSQNCGTNSITVITSGSEKFMGLVENFILDIDGSSIVATYADATNGWVITDGSW
jgi:hypothetical protein